MVLVMQYVEPAEHFSNDSIHLIKVCTKPDRKEFQKIAMATVHAVIGFAIIVLNCWVIRPMDFGCRMDYSYIIASAQKNETVKLITHHPFNCIIKV